MKPLTGRHWAPVQPVGWPAARTEQNGRWSTANDRWRI